ncbi:MAG: hypothetical protein FD180_2106 [Planctomycetota bacterium]|nr:MAG: hypothetical protein FD180_2106 [Planctomycetota bacterium]
MRFLSAAALTLAALGASAQPADPVLSDQNLAATRDTILPKPEEEKWRAIPWRTSYWTAVLDGNKAGRPVLLWTMNGHPLACT